MGLEFEFSVFGEKLINRRLERIEMRAVRAAPAFESIAGTLRGYEKRAFNSEGATTGGPWAPISDGWLAEKRRRDLDPRVLHATHRLRDSLTQRGDAEHLEIVTDNALVFGTLVPYAEAHQKAKPPRTKRRFLAFTEPQKRYILKRLQKFVMTGEV